MVWDSHLFQNFPQFIVIHTVKGFGIVSKAEIDVFLELSCFFHDPANVGNLISGSSAFSKTSLNLVPNRQFTLHLSLVCRPLGFFSFFKNVSTFTYFWLCWAFIAVRVFFNCSESGLFSSCGALTSHRRGFSGCTQAL